MKINKIESPYNDKNLPDIEDTTITTDLVFGKSVKDMRRKRKEIANRLRDTNKLADEVVDENQRESHTKKKVNEVKKLHLSERFENDFLNENLVNQLNNYARKKDFAMVEKVVNEIQHEIDTNKKLDDNDKAYYNKVANYGKKLAKNESKHKRVSHHKRMNEDTFRGVPDTAFIWHGNWADPEISITIDGTTYVANYWDVEDSMHQYYLDEKEYSETHDDKYAKDLKNKYTFDDSDEDFNKFLVDHKDDVIDDIINLGKPLDESLNEDVSKKDIVDILDNSYATSFVVDEGDYISVQGGWHTSRRKAHSDYLDVKKVLDKELGSGNYDVTYVENTSRDGGKEVSCKLEVRIKDNIIDEKFSLGANDIQNAKVYNRFNYPIQEVRIDNKNKTFERGNFSMGKPDKKFTNRQEYERFIDQLKGNGYTEIESEYKSLKNKTNTIEEDTVKKRNGKWTNRGDDGEEHGEFRTKKAADAQRKAMFANGYKAESKKVVNESLKDYLSDDAYHKYKIATKNGFDFLTYMREHNYSLKDLEYLLTTNDEVFPKGIFDESNKESLTESTMSQINAIATHYNTQDSTSAVKDVLLRIAGLSRNGIDSIDRLAREFDINESIEDKTIDEVEEFIDEVRERFPGSEAIFDGDTKTIKITLDDKVKEELTEDLDNTPIEAGAKVGLASIINDLIVDEYATINAYNSAIVTAKEEGFEDVVNVLSDIQGEENIHVGQLQKVMELFDGNANKVEDGIKEAEGQIDNKDDTTAEVEADELVTDSEE